MCGLSGHIEHYLMHVDYSLERPLHDLKNNRWSRWTQWSHIEKKLYDLENTGGLGGLSGLIEQFWAHIEKKVICGSSL